MAMYTNLSQPFWILIIIPYLLKNNEINTKEVLGTDDKIRKKRKLYFLRI